MSPCPRVSPPAPLSSRHTTRSAAATRQQSSPTQNGRSLTRPHIPSLVPPLSTYCPPLSCCTTALGIALPCRLPSASRNPCAAASIPPPKLSLVDHQVARHPVTNKPYKPLPTGSGGPSKPYLPRPTGPKPKTQVPTKLVSRSTHYQSAIIQFFLSCTPPPPSTYSYTCSHLHFAFVLCFVIVSSLLSTTPISLAADLEPPKSSRHITYTQPSRTPRHTLTDRTDPPVSRYNTE